MQMHSEIFIYPVIFCWNKHHLVMPKPSGRHAKCYAGRGVESNKIYIETHDLNKIHPKVRGPKSYLLDSIQIRRFTKQKLILV